MMLSFAYKGCQVEVGFSSFVLLSFCCLFLGGGNSSWFLAAAAWHELGHLLVLWLLGAPPARIKLTALGCRMIPNCEKILSYGQMALVSLAGPGTNLLGAVVAALMVGKGHPLFAANCILGVLHSLPIEPLDGGMALHGVLRAKTQEKTAEKLSVVVSVICLLPMAILGFVILLRTRYNFTLLAMSLYLMLYLVLKRDYLTG